MSYHLQTVVPRIHLLPLLRLLKIDHILIQWVAIGITYQNECVFNLLKINLFLVFQIAQMITQTPTRI
jgi:hypothetical protein